MASAPRMAAPMKGGRVHLRCLLGTRTRSAGATEFAIALKLRSAASERWRRARRGWERPTPGLGRMRGREQVGLPRSCQSARRSRAAAGPSRGFAPLIGERGTLRVLTGRCGLGTWGGSQPSSTPRIGAAVGASLRRQRGWVHPIPGGKRPGLSLPTPIFFWAGAGCAGGRDGEGLGPQELRPGRSDPPGRRPQTLPAEHVGDGGGGDCDAELE